MLDNYRKYLENTVKITGVHRNDFTWTFVVKPIFTAMSMESFKTWGNLSVHKGLFTFIRILTNTEIIEGIKLKPGFS